MRQTRPVLPFIIRFCNVLRLVSTFLYCFAAHQEYCASRDRMKRDEANGFQRKLKNFPVFTPLASSCFSLCRRRREAGRRKWVGMEQSSSCECCVLVCVSGILLAFSFPRAPIALILLIPIFLSLWHDLFILFNYDDVIRNRKVALLGFACFFLFFFAVSLHISSWLIRILLIGRNEYERCVKSDLASGLRETNSDRFSQWKKKKILALHAMRITSSVFVIFS